MLTDSMSFGSILKNDYPLLRSLIFLLTKLSKRRVLVKIMIITNVLVLLGLQLYLTQAVPSPFLDFEAKRSDLVDTAQLVVDRDTLHSQRSNLVEFVNSRENRDTFSKLQHNQYGFFDDELNNVGTIAFPKYNQYQRQPYVANGFIGSRIPNLGQGFTYDQLSDGPNANEEDLSNGWPLFNKRYAGAFAAGFFDIQDNVTSTNFPELLENGYESIIAAIPQWTTFQISAEVNGTVYTLDPSHNHTSLGSITNYVQNLSLTTGIVTTQFTWLDQIQVQLQVLAHRLLLNNGIVDLKIGNLNDNVPVNVSAIDILDFETAQRCQLTEIDKDESGIYVTFQPHQIDYINGAIYSKLFTSNEVLRLSDNNLTAKQYVQFELQPKEIKHLTKIVGVTTTDFDPASLDSLDLVLKKAKSSVTDINDDVETLIKKHVQDWQETLDSTLSITFPDDRLLTMAARASIYHLNANTRPEAKGVTGAVGVGGLSSDSYGGMVFWDTDLWMLNGLLPFNPDHVKSIVNYRIHTHQQAKENIPDNYTGAAYPWTSGRFGNCTATGPCIDYEYHINYAVAQAAWEVYLSGAADDKYLEDVVYPLVNDAALFYSDYVKYNDTLNQYTTRNMTDPDEYANHVNNAAYTNSAISLIMKIAISVSNQLKKPFPAIYSDIHDSIHLPTSENNDNITLEYTGMNNSVGIKQADVIMITYPLGNELIDEDQARLNKDYYAIKQVNYGPAMTYPIFSIVSSILSTSGCALYSYLQKAVIPFLRAPFAQFSEQNQDDFLTNGGTHPAFPFLTGHGGYLQAILQGFTGLKFDFEINNSGTFERVLHLDPISLPCLSNGVQFDGIKYLNHSISFNLNSDSLRIKDNGPINEQGKSIDSFNIRVGERNTKAGKYVLNSGEELTIPLYSTYKAVESSITECNNAIFTNITDGFYGEISSAMNDGDNTTHWEALHNDSTAKILVDLKQIQNVTKVNINWGDKPPKKWGLSAIDPEKLSNYSYLTNTVDILSYVDFGTDLYQYYNYDKSNQNIVKQSDIFTEIVNESVEISEPYNTKESQIVQVPNRHNTTTFYHEEGASSRFFLIEIKDIHNEAPIENDIGGAKIFEVVFE